MANTSSVLTKEEMIDLTDRQLPSKQIDWLKQNGWKYAVSASGRPKVSREYFSFKMGATVAEPSDIDQEPDFSHWTKSNK